MISVKMDKDISALLFKVFGYKSWRKNQKEIIESILNKNDTLVLMPTGGGKSLCYQIPALYLDGTAVVVSPLIALMQNQVNALKIAGVRAEFLNSTLDFVRSQDIISRLLDGKLDLLYVSPERLNKEGFLDILKRIKISLFAIDEAHCISQWGHDFRPEYTQFFKLKELFKDVVRVALTATADNKTKEDIIKNLNMQDCKVFISSFNRPNIKYVINIKNKERQQLLDFIKNEYPKDSGIVYCISRKRTEQFADFLKEQGFNAYVYHAGLSKEVRERNLNHFINDDKVIMVATIAFGMGIDKPDVRFVCHMDLPKSLEAYYQETGRAGRDGVSATAWLIYGMNDIVMQRGFITSSNAPLEQKRIEHKKLNSLLAYVETVSCRRKVLLNYFDEDYDLTCSNCDTCFDAPALYNALIESQKVLSCVYRVKQKSQSYGFGAKHIIDILRGKETEKIIKFKHNELSTYGIGADIDVYEWSSTIRQLTAMGYLEVDYKHLTLSLTESSMDILSGKVEVNLRKDILKSKNTVKKALAPKDFELLNRDDIELLNKLKKLRKDIALEQGVSTYIIFHDKALQEMVQIKPKTTEQMREVSGVGENKLKKYGALFLKEINSFILL